MVTSALLLAVAAAAPSAEALGLGRQIAESGTLAAILPMMQEKETAELLAAHPELSAADKERLKQTAKQTYESGRDRIMQAEARALAERLSVEDLRAILAFQVSPAAKRQRAAMPAVIAGTMQLIGKMDYKGDVLAAYCKETGKLCPK